MKKFIVMKSEDIATVIKYLNVVNIEKPWSVDIKKYKPNRSLAANRLYWRWIQIISDDLGYTKDELHAVLAVKFLGVVDISCMGENITQPVSTTSLKVKEMADYLTRIEVFASSELGIVLPNKDDEYYEAMGIRR
jgi:hypothetical protein